MTAIVRGVLAWIIGAAVAVGVGMLALSRIGYGLAADNVAPLNPEPSGGVPAVVAGPPTAPPSLSPTPRGEPSSPRSVRRSVPPRASATAAAAERSFSSAGGIAIVRCVGDAAYLVSWSPEQGYEVDDVRRGPAALVSVKFEGRDRTVVLSARCAGGAPQPHIGYEEEHDD